MVLVTTFINDVNVTFILFKFSLFLYVPSDQLELSDPYFPLM